MVQFHPWFFDRHTAHRESIESETVDKYLRTFSGREGVLGVMNVYRAALASIAQTDPLLVTKVRTPVLAVGGVNGLGAQFGQGVSLVGENVEACTLSDCGHFLPEERPREIVEQIVAMARRGSAPPQSRIHPGIPGAQS